MRIRNIKYRTYPNYNQPTHRDPPLGDQLPWPGAGSAENGDTGLGRCSTLSPPSLPPGNHCFPFHHRTHHQCPEDSNLRYNQGSKCNRTNTTRTGKCWAEELMGASGARRGPGVQSSLPQPRPPWALALGHRSPVVEDGVTAS